MKIVADENIPLVEHYFGQGTELLLKPGRSISQNDVFDADILLVRSITKVNEVLLHDTTVKFVGSTTAGADHLDTEWLDSQQIAWSVAAGCNAVAVAEYVICVVAALQAQGLLCEKILRAAVIGAGHVGSLVVTQLQALGFDVLVYDPLRKDENFHSVQWQELENLDLICLHTPLTHDGSHPTFHMIDKQFLEKQKANCVLLNAGRGAVVAFDDLKKYGKHLIWCFDVWEHEPDIDNDVLQQAMIATPHIAGYSMQAKYRGVEMIYQVALNEGLITKAVSPIPMPTRKISGNFSNWREKALAIYDPRVTTKYMKSGMQQFDEMRKYFVERCEFEFVKIP